MRMLKTIINNLTHKYSTRRHPFEQRVLADGFRGRFKFAIDKCIMCEACSRKCPTMCLHVEPEEGLWSREVMACVYCGLCAEVCPTGCITMTNVYRPPITEPTYLRFNVEPRKKKKVKKDATDSEKKEAIAEAILEQQKDRDKK